MFVTARDTIIHHVESRRRFPTCLVFDLRWRECGIGQLDLSMDLYICLSVSPSLFLHVCVCVFVCLCVCVSVCMSTYMSICLVIYMCLSCCLIVCMSFCICISLSLFCHDMFYSTCFNLRLIVCLSPLSLSPSLFLSLSLPSIPSIPSISFCL